MKDYSSIVNKIRDSIALIVVIQGNNIVSKGSGFIFHKKGILVTCNHVISMNNTAVKLKFSNTSEYVDARVVIRDEEHDLALLKFTDNHRKPLMESKIEAVKEGMSVVFAGYPLGLENLTTHHGILSAIIQDATGLTTYLIDGTVNRGNSGCPLLTNDGKVIGVVNAMRREYSELLGEVESMKSGAISIHGVDLINIYKALISNVQLGIGYAVPCTYIPKHHES